MVCFIFEKVSFNVQLLTQPDMDGLIHRLIKWTTNSIEPLQSYATGLLAAAMEIADIANRFRYVICCIYIIYIFYISLVYVLHK